MIRLRVKDTGLRLDVKTAEAVSFQVERAVPINGYSVGYEGPYEVTPAVMAQSLATKEKRMKEDIVINAIPIYDVSNNSGGSTVYIG